MKNVLLILILVFAKNICHAQYITIIDLMCNRQVCPVNINDNIPGLSWKANSLKRDYLQYAYQVIVSTDSIKLLQNIGDLWNSGQVISDMSVDVPYNGIKLRSWQSCWWKVKVWNNSGESSGWSKPSFWRMSFLNEADWAGEWICSDIELTPLQKQLKAMPDFDMGSEDSNWVFVERLRKTPKEQETAPAVYLRKEFTAVKKIISAYATICGLGFYELYLNGRRVGDEYLNPAFSDYERRVFYTTWDVTEYVREGSNAAGIVLGNGWFNLITPHALRYQTADYISPPQVKMQLSIQYSDGTSENIVTDKSWKFTTEGPIRFNCILSGETVDNRIRIDGWNSTGFDDAKWKTANNAVKPSGKPDAQVVFPVRKTAENNVVSVTKRNDTVFVDFGMELTGWARVKLKGKKGQVVQVYYPGAQSHTLGRYQTCKYILNGDGEEQFEPGFCYNGYNKLEITGLDYFPDKSDFTAVSVNTAMPVVSSFECSNDTLNRFQEMLVQTIKNYVVHLPNDPTREKAAWSQDIQNAFDATAYNFDCYSMYRKWQLDFLDIQHKNGYVPPVVPGRFDGPTINCPWWGGMIVYQPWKIYEFFGDRQILEMSYPAMKRYVDFLTSISNNYILSWGLGDWLEPRALNRPVKTPVPLTSTVAFFYYARIIGDAADILGKADDKQKYHELAEKIKNEFNRTFHNEDTGKYAAGSQASQLMPLCLGAVPEESRAKAESALISQDQG